jgi:hypothetical protein
LAAQVKGYDKIGLARAHFASSVGVAIHVAEAAGLAGIPYMLGSSEEGYVRGYEQENFRLRRSVGQILLNRLNAGARAELCKLAELGVMSVFPETPIASLIVQNASSPRGMLEVAIELRNEFASYRRHMNQMEYDLANKDQPLRLQLKRLRELEHLAGALWPGAQTDLKTTALGISEALLAIPEVVGTPSASSLGGLVAKLGSLPVEKLMDVYRRRKIRLLLKAKSNFLKGHDATAKIGSILGVPEEIVRRSRVQGRARPRGR